MGKEEGGGGREKHGSSPKAACPKMPCHVSSLPSSLFCLLFSTAGAYKEEGKAAKRMPHL